MVAKQRPIDGLPMAVTVEGGLAIVAVLLAWLFGVPLRSQLPANGQALAAASARGVLAALPMLLLFWILVRSQHPSLRHLRTQVEWLVQEMFPSRRTADFALVALLAGVGEELLFRGVLQFKLSEWFTPTVGLILAGLLFGAAHAVSKLYFVLATLIGIYLGCFVQYFGELVTPIVAHALYDFLALVYLARVGRRHEPGSSEDSDSDRRKLHEKPER